MTQENSSTETASRNESGGNTSHFSKEEGKLAITRVVDAPRELVYRAWTDPVQIARWWGPRYFTNPVCELDMRPGGAILIHMKGPDGVIYPMTGEFREVVENERLVFVSQAITDEAGEVQLEDVTTVTFTDHEGGKTLLTVQGEITKATPEAEGALSGMEEGWNMSLDRLAEELASAQA